MEAASTGSAPKRAAKFVAIILASAVFSVLLHKAHHDPLMSLASKPRSIAVTSGYFPAIAFAALVMAFSIIGLTFLAIQKELPGKKERKGVLFGVALGGMYFVGMIEAYVVYPVPFLGEIYTGLVDGVAIVAMCFLLGRHLAGVAPDAQKQPPPAYAIAASVVISYVLVRYFAYAAIGIESAYSSGSLATLLWTTGMGCWIGVIYLLVGIHISKEDTLKQALAFGAFVFGMNWLIFNLFVLLFIKIPVADLLYRSIADAIAVTVGVYAPSAFRRRPPLK